MAPCPTCGTTHDCREAALLRQMVDKLGEAVNEQGRVLKTFEQENAQLKHEVAQLRRRVLGPTSEKMPSISSELRRRKQRRGKQTRKRRAPKTAEKPSQTLETETRVHHVPQAERCCPNCPGVSLVTLGTYEISTEYEYIAARFIRREHRREKLSCPRCKSTVVTAPAPLKVYDKAHYGAGFFAHLIVAKCADAIPIYRQAKQLARLGVPISRSTMTDLFHRAAGLLRPLIRRMEQIVARASHVQGDETSFRIQEPDKCRRGFIWTFIGSGLIVYRYSADRSGQTPNLLLGGTTGKLLVDGYTGYNHVCDVDGRQRAGCLAHCRRNFFDALPTAPDAAQHALDTILDVYAVEHQAIEADIVGTEAHGQLRTTQTKPIMDRFKQWLEREQPMHLPKSPMAKAIGYALNQWQPLTLFLQDPKLPVDNNESERRLRLIALGRKNYLFSADDEGAENLATLMSLVVTCEAHDINPEDYLADVLLRIQIHPNARIDDLLPPMWQHLRESGELPPLPDSS